MSENDYLMIAPCGFNCENCAQYQKVKNSCEGCRIRTTKKSQICTMKNCDKNTQTNKNISLCMECDKFPCRRLREFDKRYQKITNGYLSVIENLREIEKYGVEKFLKKEKSKWTCPQCGSRLCVTSNICSSCGFLYRK